MKQTAVEFLKDYELGNTGKIDIDDAKEALIEFAKMHIEKIMNLQQSKYYAGETGYITKEEWQDLLNVN